MVASCEQQRASNQTNIVYNTSIPDHDLISLRTFCDNIMQTHNAISYTRVNYEL